MGDDVVIAAIDVGGRANIGWVVDNGTESAPESDTGNTTLDELIELLRQQLAQGRPVALGIEAPLYLPIARSEKTINSARVGESNRAWSASSGSSVATLGVHQLAYVLHGLRDSLAAGQVGFDERLLDSGPSLMIWEAFISGDAKGESHEHDARIAVDAFRSKLAGESMQSDLPHDPSDLVVNIAAAAILAVWPDSSSAIVSEPCLVVKPG